MNICRKFNVLLATFYLFSGCLFLLFGLRVMKDVIRSVSFFEFIYSDNILFFIFFFWLIGGVLLLVGYIHWKLRQVPFTKQKSVVILFCLAIVSGILVLLENQTASIFHCGDLGCPIIWLAVLMGPLFWVASVIVGAYKIIRIRSGK